MVRPIQRGSLSVNMNTVPRLPALIWRLQTVPSLHRHHPSSSHPSLRSEVKSAEESKTALIGVTYPQHLALPAVQATRDQHLVCPRPAQTAWKQQHLVWPCSVETARTQQHPARTDPVQAARNTKNMPTMPLTSGQKLDKLLPRPQPHRLPVLSTRVLSLTAWKSWRKCQRHRCVTQPCSPSTSRSQSPETTRLPPTLTAHQHRDAAFQAASELQLRVAHQGIPRQYSMFAATLMVYRVAAMARMLIPT